VLCEGKNLGRRNEEGIPVVKSRIHLTHMATKSASVASASAGSRVYEEYVNPQRVALLNLLDMNVEYKRCADCELFTSDGRRILDFLSGYCVHNVGHFGQVLVMRMFREKNTLTQICGNDFMVLKAAPPWTVSEEQWTEALAPAKRAVV